MSRQKHRNRYNNKRYNNNYSNNNNNSYDDIKFKDNNAINIDGSEGEGGGQIIRNSMALSSLLNKSINIYNIRGKRKVPGLRPQHQTGNTIINSIFNGTLMGNNVKSMKLYYKPGIRNNNSNKMNEFYGDTKTAGSLTLLLQTCLPCLLFLKNESQLELKGGTDVSFSPPIDFYIYVFRPLLYKLFNINFDINIISRGFYPKGGGHIILKTKPIKYLPAFDLTKSGKIVKIFGNICICSNYYTQNDINWMINQIRNILNNRFFCKKNNIDMSNINVEYCKSKSEGLSMVIIIENENGYISNSCLSSDIKYINGESNIDYLSKIINKCLNGLLTDYNNGNTIIDKYLQDQLIIFMALAKGTSKIKISSLIELHTKSAIDIATSITGAKFNIVTQNDSTHIVQCNGIGLINPYLNNNNNNNNNTTPTNDNYESKTQNNDNNNNNSTFSNRKSLF